MAGITLETGISAALFLGTFVAMGAFVLSALNPPHNWIMAAVVGMTAVVVYVTRRRLNAPKPKEAGSV